MDERTPLLLQSKPHHFSSRRKSAILALTSFAALLALFTVSSFVPTIQQIALDLNTTPDLVNLSIAIYLFVLAFASLLWSSYASYYGRRPIYLLSLPIYIGATIGVVLCASVTQLIVFRALQGFGSCSFIPVGASAIADIYDVEKRGYAMGIFWGITLLAPALAPFIGGLAAQYFSWRILQASQGITGLVILIIIALFLPETSRYGTRGIDNDTRRKKVETSQDELSTSSPSLKRRISDAMPVIVLLNPFKPLLTLLEPHLLAVCVILGLQMMTEYALLIPLPYTIGQVYNITDSGLIGATFIPAGIGNIIGAPLAGSISDSLLKKYKSRRGGVRVPEDRLRVAWGGSAFFTPLSVLLSGLAMTFLRDEEGVAGWKSKVGLSVCMVCLFMNGVGIDSVFGPCIAYTADVTHHRSAEAIAAGAAARHLFIALVSACILPLIGAIGIAWAYMLIACITWSGCGLLWLTIRYGASWRERSSGEYKDIDVSRAEDHASSQHENVPSTAPVTTTTMTINDSEQVNETSV